MNIHNVFYTFNMRNLCWSYFWYARHHLIQVIFNDHQTRKFSKLRQLHEDKNTNLAASITKRRRYKMYLYTSWKYVLSFESSLKISSNVGRSFFFPLQHLEISCCILLETRSVNFGRYPSFTLFQVDFFFSCICFE